MNSIENTGNKPKLDQNKDRSFPGNLDEESS